VLLLSTLQIQWKRLIPNVGTCVLDQCFLTGGRGWYELSGMYLVEHKDFIPLGYCDY
jgi:hypothetical protein